jgi:hypothetical protein
MTGLLMACIGLINFFFFNLNYILQNKEIRNKLSLFMSSKKNQSLLFSIAASQLKKNNVFPKKRKEKRHHRANSV